MKMKMTNEQQIILAEVLDEWDILDEQWDALDCSPERLETDFDGLAEKLLCLVGDYRRLGVKAIHALPGLDKVPIIVQIGMITVRGLCIFILHKIYKLCERLGS